MDTNDKKPEDVAKTTPTSMPDNTDAKPEVPEAKDEIGDLVVPEPAVATAKPDLTFESPIMSDAPVMPGPATTRSSKKQWLIVSVALIVLLALAAMAYWFIYLANPSDDMTMPQHTTHQASASATPTASVSASPSPTPSTATVPNCGALSVFADKVVGLSFCYPKVWGATSVTDAKFAAEDTGFRQSITFADMPLFGVGAASADWSTATGRGLGCLEPNNVVPTASDYNTDWHGIIGSGDDIEFAERSLPSVKGGYDLTETVDGAMMAGVCVQGHKVINGSRYKVVFAGFYRMFPEASGITTPKLHMDTPTVLFSPEQRAQYDALLDSMKAY